MNILISQPSHEQHLEQMRREIQIDYAFDVLLFPECYIVDEASIVEACALAKQYKKMIISGYIDRNKKDRALIINPDGEIILERAKSPMDSTLYSPSTVDTELGRIGYLLCVELLQGYAGLNVQQKLQFIAHPIGVGMFSEEQFDEWIAEAKRIAIKYNTIILGASHTDGSYRNCGVSIPIAYCIDHTGAEVFVSKNDVRTRIINLDTMECEMIEHFLMDTE